MHRDFLSLQGTQRNGGGSKQQSLRDYVAKETFGKRSAQERELHWCGAMMIGVGREKFRSSSKDFFLQKVGCTEAGRREKNFVAKGRKGEEKKPRFLWARYAQKIL